MTLYQINQPVVVGYLFYVQEERQQPRDVWQDVE